MKKRIFTAILALLMVSAAFVGCKKDEAPAEDTTAPVAVDTVASTEPVDTKVPLKELPDVNYNNYKFRIIVRKSAQREDFFAENNADDLVEAAVWARNESIKEKYGVVLEELKFDNQYGSVTELAPSLDSGDDSYDLIVPHGRMSTGYALGGYCVDWYQLPYQNLTYDWWSQGARECFTVNGRIYFITGDLCHLSTAASYCVMFNKDVINDAQINLYQHVKDGTWTFAKMSQYALDCADDMNGNGQYVLGEDRLGYITLAWAGTYCSFFSSGNRIVQNDENGAPYISIATDTAQTALTNFFALVNSGKAYQEPEDGNGSFGSVMKAGKFVFYDCTLGGIADTYRQSDLNYGIVPYPKTSDTVEGYTSHTAGAYNMLIIPRTSKNLERTSVVLEALAQEGHNYVIPVYYDNIVTKRTAKDYDDYEMISYIADARIYDLGYYFADLGACSSLLNKLAKENYSKQTGATIFYSLYTNNASKGNENLKKLLAAYSD